MSVSVWSLNAFRLVKDSRVSKSVRTEKCSLPVWLTVSDGGELSGVWWRIISGSWLPLLTLFLAVLRVTASSTFSRHLNAFVVAALLEFLPAGAAPSELQIVGLSLCLLLLHPVIFNPSGSQTVFLCRFQTVSSLARKKFSLVFGTRGSRLLLQFCWMTLFIATSSPCGFSSCWGLSCSLCCRPRQCS